jgi:membrane protease YdiL (CAAX protease family)
VNRLARIQIVVAAVAAIALLFIRSGTLTGDYGVLSDALEALSFMLCVVAILNSGRELRGRYQRLGSNQQAARKSAEYMHMRQSVRWWCYLATLIIAALVAVRFDVSALMVIGALAVALPILMIVTDQASGWRGRIET